MTTTSANTFRQFLTGTWSLLTITAVSTTDSSRTVHPFGEVVAGHLTYAPDGFMSSLVQTGNLPNWAAGWGKPTSDEALSTIRATTTYHGPFYIEEGYPEHGGVAKDDLGDGKSVFRRTLYHDIKVAMPPNWRGELQKRLLTMKRGEEGKWYLTMRVEEEIELGNLGGKEIEGKWRLEIQFVKVEVHEPEKAMDREREVKRL